MVPSVQKSVARTPNEKRRKTRSYRLSYQSMTVHNSSTRALTSLRLNTKRTPNPDNILDKVDPKQLASLMGTKWQLSYVTPLYRFRYTQLKSYARQLSAFMAAERQKGLAVEEGSTQSLRITFSVVHGLAVTDDDAETILIQIYDNSLFAGQDDHQKTVWRGWLACVNGNSDSIKSLPKEFMSLPLFGSSGTETLTALVKSWFQKNFDCCFGLLEINQTTLEWLVALWTNCHMDSNIKQLKMIWTLPFKPPLQVTYAVHPDDAWELWRGVKVDQADNVIDREDSINFIKGLMGHFYRFYLVDLSAGNLSHVSTALGTAESNGRIKFSNSKSMITTLTLLTECALLKMPF
ncbi:centromere protein L [Syngnathus typhle]|uniref:centromere protein L n=1 Tax=Syngnathus typhle TaxID=161592 RepID=UPI002A69E24A|nr:centromere protein L [Syngnathus typhle]